MPKAAVPAKTWTQRSYRGGSSLEDRRYYRSKKEARAYLPPNANPPKSRTNS